MGLSIPHVKEDEAFGGNGVTNGVPNGTGNRRKVTLPISNIIASHTLIVYVQMSITSLHDAGDRYVVQLWLNIFATSIGHSTFLSILHKIYHIYCFLEIP